MANDVLFEIGMEELPARFVDEAEKQLKEKTISWLQDLRITYESITSFSTPRRLAILIKDIANEQTTIEEEVKGPAVKIAKDTEDNWTKAAIGFTKGQGKTTDDIFTKDLKGSSYIFVKKHIVGVQTIDLLPSFKKIIESLQFPKSMRWAEETLRYARPIRWIVALYGNEVIPFEVAGVSTDNKTFGHRFLGREITLDIPSEYKGKLHANFVIVDSSEREKLIVDAIKKLEVQQGFHISVEEDLLNEVRNLVEYPTVFMGSFDDSFLELPAEVLVSSMQEHQRYFPVKSEGGNLLPNFVGVRNGDDTSINTVIKGNEKVLHARLSDARFFYEEDQKHSLDYYLEKLKKVVFQQKLGTISDKSKRVMHITEQLSLLLQIDSGTRQRAVRTAEICKFDLTTDMVNEFTELQGVIGETYALHFGEDEAVAKAIKEHYLPLFANGTLPVSTEGSLVSIADKLDTIVGCISVGLIPSGSQDPYGLRRQAMGILKLLRDKKWDITLEKLLGLTQHLYETLNIELVNKDNVTDQLTTFFRLRATYLLKEMNIEQDVIDAVLHHEIGVTSYMMDKADILSEKRNDDQFKFVQEALVRVLNLAKKAQETEINKDIIETESEKKLYETYQIVQEAYKDADEELDATGALNQLEKLADPIHTFFEHNMVMADNEQIRHNRLGLINNVAGLINEFADLSVVAWKQHF